MGRESTQWRPGQSGNPGGRPAVVGLVRQFAQADTPQAYEMVKNLMLGAQKDSVRLAAALAILRMAGVPMDSISPAGSSLPSQPPSSKAPTGTLLSIVKQKQQSTPSGDEES